MKSLKGKQRVIIDNIRPQVSGGQYPSKAVIGKEVLLSADIFTDGHDEVSASVLMRHTSDKKWQEIPLNFIENDRWELPYVPQHTGFYQFRVQAWVNHFRTWQKGLLKKLKAGQDITIELQIGVELLEKAILKAGPKEKKRLQAYASELANEEDKEKAVALASDEILTQLMLSCRNAALVTVYPQTFTIEAERSKAGFSTWYELFPRSASKEQGTHGTFNDVKELLPQIAHMGFDVLYFPPIHPIGELKRKGKNNALVAAADDPGSPWAVGSKLGGHKSIHPELGTMKEFQALIKTAKKYHLEIALDIAFQCAPDHPYVKEHPEWFKWRPDGTVQYAENPPKRYEDILPFNFETDDWQNLWLELKTVFEFWIHKGVSIFRIDNPHTKAFAFWEWVIREIRNEKPEVIFLAEAFTRPRIMEQLAKAGFNQSYTYFTWRNTKEELETYMEELTQTKLRDFFRPNFWPNTPDILPPEITKDGENNMLIRLILAATLSSNYGLYGPVYELGLTEPAPGKEEYIDSEKYEIKAWDWNAETRLKEVITLVNYIRRNNSALQDTYNIEFAESSNEKIICYLKTAKQDHNRLIIAVNLDPHNVQSATVNVPLENLGIKEDEAYTVLDLLSRETYTWKGSANYVQLDPHAMPAHILRIEPNN
jgi:starch synthase (maltosyl-transferring)